MPHIMIEENISQGASMSSCAIRHWSDRLRLGGCIANKFDPDPPRLCPSLRGMGFHHRGLWVKTRGRMEGSSSKSSSSYFTDSSSLSVLLADVTWYSKASSSTGALESILLAGGRDHRLRHSDVRSQSAVQKVMGWTKVCWWCTREVV